MTLALGPGGGTGERGCQKIDALSAAIWPREHRVVYGAFDPNDLPKSILERVFA